MSINRITSYLLSILIIALTACASTLRPLYTQPVQPGLESRVNESLEKLPKPKDKVVAAVYRFNDQTGQYKSSDQVASWSTAVTQGATSILIKAMEQSGWFIPIEREGLSNLLNERKIINATRTQNNDNNKLSPLLFAGVILEGGIIGYDTNLITGGAGVRYFGTSVSGQFRRDQVTIYLRAVSTQTGRVLKTVHTTKSILSQKLDGGLFRFIDTNRLLEAEAGYTYNEPPVMAVTEAIDEALRMLVIDGVHDGLWEPSDSEAFNIYEQKFKATQRDRVLIASSDSSDVGYSSKSIPNIDYFGFKRNSQLRSGFSANVNFAYGSYIGNYADPLTEPGASVQLEQFIAPSFSLKLDVMRSRIGAQQIFSEYFNSANLSINAYVMPDFNITPYVGLGGGVLAYDRRPKYARHQFFPTVSAEAGLDYRFNDWLGVRAGFIYRYTIQDGIDGETVGSIHDQQWNILTGLIISPKFKWLFK